YSAPTSGGLFRRLASGLARSPRWTQLPISRMRFDGVSQGVAISPFQVDTDLCEHLVCVDDLECSTVYGLLERASADARRTFLQIHRIGQIRNDFVVVHGNLRLGWVDIHQRMHAFVEDGGFT